MLQSLRLEHNQNLKSPKLLGLIDRRVRAKEFMMLMSIGRTKFYRMIKNGEIPQPIKVSEKEVFWHESSVKKVVEKHKDNSDMIAC